MLASKIRRCLIGPSMLLIVASSPVQAHEDRPKPFVNLSTIVQLKCDQGSGTAFHIGSGMYLTAQHVLAAQNCQFANEGIPATIAFEDEALDYALIQGPVLRFSLPIDCEGFRKGRVYHAYGYPSEGFSETRVVSMGKYFKPYAGYPWRGQGFLNGPFLPGQSGGPAIDYSTGKVVGIVNGHRIPTYIPSYSRELKDTILCTMGS